MIFELIIHKYVLLLCNYVLYIINYINNDYLRNQYFIMIDYLQLNQMQSFIIKYIEKSLLLFTIWLCIYVKYRVYK